MHIAFRIRRPYPRLEKYVGKGILRHVGVFLRVYSCKEASPATCACMTVLPTIRVLAATTAVEVEDPPFAC